MKLTNVSSIFNYLVVLCNRLFERLTTSMSRYVLRIDCRHATNLCQSFNHVVTGCYHRLSDNWSRRRFQVTLSFEIELIKRVILLANDGCIDSNSFEYSSAEQRYIVVYCVFLFSFISQCSFLNYFLQNFFTIFLKLQSFLKLPRSIFRLDMYISLKEVNIFRLLFLIIYNSIYDLVQFLYHNDLLHVK